jgi:3-hydroxyisobutyrate dehydrogenase-like beta-hydroxyacid dehydrogenase
MGGAIARRLASEGRRLLVCDPDEKATQSLRALGADIAETPRNVADQAEIVIACLPSPAICREVALGAGGVAGGRRIVHYIETSTMGSEVAAELAGALAKHHIRMLDAPISGGPAAAASGTLAAIAAGPKDTLEACRSVIALYSDKIFHVSEQAGGAQLSKLINNAIAIFGMLLTFEGLAVATEAKLDLPTLISLINASTGANFASKVIVPASVLADPPVAAGRMEILLKDLQLYMRELAGLGLNPAVAPRLLEIAEQAGSDGNADVAAALRRFFLDIVRMPPATGGPAFSHTFTKD